MSARTKICNTTNITDDDLDDYFETAHSLSCPPPTSRFILLVCPALSSVPSFACFTLRFPWTLMLPSVPYVLQIALSHCRGPFTRHVATRFTPALLRYLVLSHVGSSTIYLSFLASFILYLPTPPAICTGNTHVRLRSTPMNA